MFHETLKLADAADDIESIFLPNRNSCARAIKIANFCGLKRARHVTPRDHNNRKRPLWAIVANHDGGTAANDLMTLRTFRRLLRRAIIRGGAVVFCT